MVAGPYDSVCGAITPNYAKWAGLQVAKGYRDRLRRLFGRTQGCTHTNDLAGLTTSRYS